MIICDYQSKSSFNIIVTLPDEQIKDLNSVIHCQPLNNTETYLELNINECNSDLIMIMMIEDNFNQQSKGVTNECR